MRWNLANFDIAYEIPLHHFCGCGRCLTITLEKIFYGCVRRETEDAAGVGTVIDTDESARLAESETQVYPVHLIELTVR